MDVTAMMTSRKVAQLVFGAETPEEIKREEGYLAQLRYKGTGPKFFKEGNKIMYPVRELNEWVEARITSRTRSLEEAGR